MKNLKVKGRRTKNLTTKMTINIEETMVKTNHPDMEEEFQRNIH
jgi:hypothetical protein